MVVASLEGLGGAAVQASNLPEMAQVGGYLWKGFSVPFPLLHFMNSKKKMYLACKWITEYSLSSSVRYTALHIRNIIT